MRVDIEYNRRFVLSIPCSFLTSFANEEPGVRSNRDAMTDRDAMHLAETQH